jgi:hypothetical protein
MWEIASAHLPWRAVPGKIASQRHIDAMRRFLLNCQLILLNYHSHI